MTQNGETKIYPFFPSYDPMWIDHVHDSREEAGSDSSLTVMTCGDSQVRCETANDLGDGTNGDCVNWTGTDINGNNVSLSGTDLICNASANPVPAARTWVG